MLLTTHYMDEAQNLADRVAVISEGLIAAAGTPATLAGPDSARATVTFTLPEGVMPPADLGARRMAGGVMEFAPEDLTVALHRLTGWALDRSLSLESLRVLPARHVRFTHSTKPALSNGRPAPGRRWQAQSVSE